MNSNKIMGYTTYFKGCFKLYRKLDGDLYEKKELFLGVNVNGYTMETKIV